MSWISPAIRSAMSSCGMGRSLVTRQWPTGCRPWRSYVNYERPKRLFNWRHENFCHTQSCRTRAEAKQDADHPDDAGNDHWRWGGDCDGEHWQWGEVAGGGANCEPGTECDFDFLRQFYAWRSAFRLGWCGYIIGRGCTGH